MSGETRGAHEERRARSASRPKKADGQRERTQTTLRNAPRPRAPGDAFVHAHEGPSRGRSASNGLQCEHQQGRSLRRGDHARSCSLRSERSGTRGDGLGTCLFEPETCPGSVSHRRDVSSRPRQTRRVDLTGALAPSSCFSSLRESHTHFAGIERSAPSARRDAAEPTIAWQTNLAADATDAIAIRNARSTAAAERPVFHRADVGLFATTSDLELTLASVIVGQGDSGVAQLDTFVAWRGIRDRRRIPRIGRRRRRSFGGAGRYGDEEQRPTDDQQKASGPHQRTGDSMIGRCPTTNT